MSIIRQNPATKEWVIIAAERAKRPHDFIRHDKVSEPPAWAGKCPFCPGNEASTPPATLSLPPLTPEVHSTWQVRAFPNRFPALAGEGSAERQQENSLFRYMNGIGAHEVIVEHPQHNKHLALMEIAEIETVLDAYRERYLELSSLPYVKFVLIFKNHGEGAGTSLEHPHSQIVATPVASSQVRQRYEIATAYYDDIAHCLYRDIVEAELKTGTRIIWEDDRLVAFHPFASQRPFETWIAPKSHCSSYGDICDADITSLAKGLRRILKQLYIGLNNPDFNYIVHSAPAEDEHRPYYLWHLQIMPRLTTVAGFEMGSGIYINTALPEETAQFIRNVSV